MPSHSRMVTVLEIGRKFGDTDECLTRVVCIQSFKLVTPSGSSRTSSITTLHTKIGLGQHENFTLYPSTAVALAQRRSSTTSDLATQ
eukprot:scaffold39184_cov22-Cyclotella_meneghiniana.AAC.3